MRPLFVKENMMKGSKRLEHHSRDMRSRFLAASSAGGAAIFGLGGFALAPAANSAHHAPVAAHPADSEHPQAKSSPPRMLENGAPFSFADLVERVSPAVVTVTVEQQMKPTQAFNPEELPEPFRDFFNQFGEGGRQFSQPRKAV